MEQQCASSVPKPSEVQKLDADEMSQVKTTLKKTETKESNTLPDQKTIDQEKGNAAGP